MHDEGPPATPITDPAELPELAGRLRAAGRIALDTEANGFHAYRPRLCLVQLAWREAGRLEVALVDPLALGDELGALAGPLADPAIATVVHGADYDVKMLARDAGVALRGLVDTEAAARLLGLSRTGLASLAEEILGEKLDKGPQRFDWSRRPLPEKVLRYAAHDVAVLLPIAEEIESRLAALGRFAWAEEEWRSIERVEPPPDEEPEREALLARAAGAGRLDPRRRAVLAELLYWREVEARRRDVPAVHLAPPRALLRIAERRPRDERGLVKAGLPAPLARRHGAALLAALARGAEAPPIPRRRSSGPSPGDAPEIDGERLARLKKVRARHAAQLGLDEGVVCPSALLKEVLRHPLSAESVEGLVELGFRRWQAERLRAELEAALGLR